MMDVIRSSVPIKLNESAGVKSLVVGNGLIARSFCNAKFSSDTVVVASGVSNSGESRHSEFSRERRLILDTIAAHSDSTIVYFSTTSLLSKIQTPYVNHKIEMEQLVGSMAKSFYIFRLPQVVGLVRNNTLVSYFVQLDYQWAAIGRATGGEAESA